MFYFYYFLMFFYLFSIYRKLICNYFLLKTIKLPYNTTPDNYPLISNIIREQTIIKKWSYKRFKENKSEKEIRKLIPTLNNINIIDSWLTQSSILDGKQVFLSKLRNKRRVKIPMEGISWLRE